MRISSKGRYALAASVILARIYHTGEFVTVNSISENLGLSKIYLEQVFSLLRRGGIVRSVKGSQGGYQLALPPEQLTALDVLSAAELSLFEPAEATVTEKAPDIESAMRKLVYDALERSVRECLRQVPLSHLVSEADQYGGNALMFYI